MAGSIDTGTRGDARRWLVLGMVSVGLLLITLDMSVLYTALPTLTEELGASPSQKLWIINAYPLAVAGLLLGTGTLGDRIGHRTMFLAGLGIFGAASAFAAFAPSADALIVARALLGVGAATMMPATLSLLRIAFVDERERNVAIAVWGSIAIVGSALGPIVGGVLLEFFWWGSVFLINLPIVLIAIVAAVRIAPRGGRNPEKPWDLVASGQVMVGLLGTVYAIKEATKPGASLVVVAIAILAAVVGFALFARRQRRSAHPLLDVSIFRNPIVLSGVIGAGIAMFAFAGVQLMTSQRFQLVDDFSPLKTGLMITAMAAGSLLTALIGGSILHRVGFRPLISGGFALTAVGVLTTLLMIDAGPGWALPGLFLSGGGLGLVMAVASSAIIGNVPAERAGMASSVEEISYELGSLMGVAILGSVVGAVYTRVIDLPAGAPAAAGEGIDAARAAAADGGAGSVALLDAAHRAFTSGYDVVLLIILGVLVGATAVTAWLLRGPSRRRADRRRRQPVIAGER